MKEDQMKEREGEQGKRERVNERERETEGERAIMEALKKGKDQSG
jgi:hypothetical protein